MVSLFRPEIVRELELSRHGYQVLPRDPSSFTPLPDGRALLLGPDLAANQREIARFSARDAERFPRYEALLDRIARAIEPALLEAPPDPFSGRPGDLLRLARTGWRLLRLGKDGPRALEVLLGAARLVPSYRPIPRLPAVLRDLAVVVDEAVTAAAVEALVREEALVEAVTLFDVYRGAPLPPGRKNLALAITYRAPDRTLTDAEADAAHARIVERLARGVGAELRG